MHVHTFASVDSTNEQAKRLLQQAGFHAPALILAETQTAGRGTRGRSWHSPPGGLYLTLIEAPPPMSGNVNSSLPLPLYTLAAGVACAAVLREETGAPVRLKAINDLLLDGGKLGGILTEAFIEQGRVRALLTGVGLNIRRIDDAFASISPLVASLEAHLPPAQFAQLDVPSLARLLAEQILIWHARAAADGERAIRRAWSRYSSDPWPVSR